MAPKKARLLLAREAALWALSRLPGKGLCGADALGDSRQRCCCSFVAARVLIGLREGRFCVGACPPLEQKLGWDAFICAEADGSVAHEQLSHFLFEISALELNAMFEKLVPSFDASVLVWVVNGVGRPWLVVAHPCGAGIHEIRDHGVRVAMSYEQLRQPLDDS